jgi:hypothetical protein
MRWANQLGVVLLGSVVASAVIFVACGSTDSPDGATPDGGSGKGGTANGGTGAQGGAAGSGGETGSNLVCVPGTTMECVGPGACRGGQSCNAEGTSYGTCDCGTGGVDGSDDAPTSNGDSSPD